MNALTSRNRTLGELATELRARLGFVTQGPASHNNDAVIHSFLQEAHDYVYGELDPPVLKKRAEISLSSGSRLYDYNNDVEDEPIDPLSVKTMWILWPDSEQASELRQGITEGMRSFSTVRQMPERWDTLNGQIELYPTPDQAYTLVVEYTAGKNRFTQQSDRPSVPDRLLLQYAIATAKAHYRHPDAQVSAISFKTMLDKQKSRQHENRRYFVGGGSEIAPQVVKTAAGYSLKVR